VQYFIFKKMENNSEVILLAFSTVYVQRTIQEKLQCTQLAVGSEQCVHPNYGQYQLYKTRSALLNCDVHHAVFQHPIMSTKLEALAACANRQPYAKVLLIDRNTMGPDPEDLALNWYIINSVERLEQCLAIQLAPEVRDHIAQMALPLTARIDRTDNPFSVGGSDDTVFWIIPRRANRRLFYEDLVDHPRVETRTPLKSEWEERLKQTKEAPKDSDANPDVNSEGTPTCCICMDSEPTIMLAPCMHQCVCDVCVKELMERDLQSKKCPICRADIADIYKPIK
jgi:hypothetical protein